MQNTTDPLSSYKESQVKEFNRIKKIVLKVVPEAEQVVSYGMPTFKYKGKVLLHFGGFKNHMSLFPGSGSVYQKMQEKLKSFHTSKGTLQFTEDKPINNDLVEEIVSIRLADIIEGRN